MGGNIAYLDFTDVNISATSVEVGSSVNTTTTMNAKEFIGVITSVDGVWVKYKETNITHVSPAAVFVSGNLSRIYFADSADGNTHYATLSGGNDTVVITTNRIV